MRIAPRRAHIPYWLIVASVAAALLAVLPIFGAIIDGGAGPTAAGRAFASAPHGLYAVVAQTEGSEDRVMAIQADGEGDARDVIRIPHLDGFTSSGAVSPDGSRLALITADQGTVARPLASLLIIDLRTSTSRSVSTGVDHLQTPIWSPDGSSVIVTRTTGDGPLVDVAIIGVAVDGGETLIGEARGVLGAYPAGVDATGAAIWVVIDSRGSTLVRDGADVRSLAPGVTRDWRLNPGGTTIAFIETDTSHGLRYIQRVAPLASGGPREQVSAPSGQALGVAWRPGANDPTFGIEPGAGVTGGGRGQRADGFDVPLGYSPDGRLLAVQAWSGTSFKEAGSMRLTIIGPSGRAGIPASRFYGWAAR